MWRETAGESVALPGPGEVDPEALVTPTDEVPSPSGPTTTPTETPTPTPTSTGGPTPTGPTPTPTPSGTPEPGTPGGTGTVPPTAPTPAPTTTSGEEETPTATPTPSELTPSAPTDVTTGPDPTDGPTEPGETTTTIIWNTPPASQASEIPGVMVAVAISVLALAALVLALVRRRGEREDDAVVGRDAQETAVLSPVLEEDADGADTVVIAASGDEDGPAGPAGPAGATEGGTGADAPTLTRFLIALGEALIDCASPVAEVTRTLEDVGRANGFAGTEVIALPTAILVTVPGSASTQTAAASAGVRSFRLDQTEDVLHIAERARRGEIGPVEGMGELQRAVSSAAPYRTPVLLGGYVTYSLGIALILGASLADLLVAGVLGLLVAVVQLATARTSGYLQALVVLTSAFTVSAVVFGLVRVDVPIDVLSSLVPPLVLFLPGALLTTAVIDLATRQMIAGSARLAAGVMQLVLLALGISGAAGLVGVRASAIAEAPGQAFGALGPWVGVLVFVAGVALYHCVRLDSVPWVLAVVLVAYAGQVLGGLVFGGVMSALVGAAVMTPLALYAARQRNGPPALVSFLPGFWVLVPGALGLVGVTQTLDGTATDGMSTILTAAATMVAISLGVLVGIAVHGLATAVRVPVRRSASPLAGTPTAPLRGTPAAPPAGSPAPGPEPRPDPESTRTLPPPD